MCANCSLLLYVIRNMVLASESIWNCFRRLPGHCPSDKFKALRISNTAASAACNDSHFLSSAVENVAIYSAAAVFVFLRFRYASFASWLCSSSSSHTKETYSLDGLVFIVWSLSILMFFSNSFIAHAH